MKNPWKHLPKTQPYLLKTDRDIIELFNKKNKGKDCMIKSELLPEPYLGKINAEIILLNLNPGFSESDKEFHQNNRYFREICRKNLFHKDFEYSFYLLDPKISDSPGHKWWIDEKKGRLRKLLEISDSKTIANKICCIEYFPYHSKKFKKIKEPLPSQKYTFYLVKKAIERKATIIIMRSKNLWFDAVPELKNYKTIYILKSPQNVVLSEHNCPKKSFNLIEKILTSAKNL
jgi:hypothetical protein